MSSISVIIPAYNAEKYIGEAIESALAQTRAAQEVIVVDDASTDRTVEIARSFGARLQVLVYEVNTGPGHSRNIGVAHSTGEYLSFLDADDRWRPDHLALVAGLLDRFPEAGVSFARKEHFGAEKGCWPEIHNIPLQPDDILLALLRSDLLVSSTAMIRRTVFMHAGGFPEETVYHGSERIQMEDAFMFFKCAHITKFVASPAATVEYRCHPGQSSRHLIEQQRLGYSFRLNILADLESRRDPLYPAALDRVRTGWEKRLETCWSVRDLAGLRTLISWGLQSKYLRRASWTYAWKAVLPDGLIRRMERPRQDS